MRPKSTTAHVDHPLQQTLYDFYETAAAAAASAAGRKVALDYEWMQRD